MITLINNTILKCILLYFLNVIKQFWMIEEQIASFGWYGMVMPDEASEN